MALKEILEQTALKELENLNLYILPSYSRVNSSIISFLHEKRIIDDDSIEKALESAVISRAKKDYDVVVSKKIYPDHFGKPEYLAYAISHEIFSRRQLQKIPFDHGETPETFCQHYGRENLLENLREELLNPESLPRLEGCTH